MSKTKVLTFPERVQALHNEYVESHRKYNLASQIVILFPNKKKAPILAKWAGAMIIRLGGQLDIKYFDLKETKNG